MSKQIKDVKIESDWDLQSLQKFVQEKIAPTSLKNFNDGHFQESLYKQLHSMGTLQAITPKEYGGQAAEVADLIWIVRELAYGSAGAAATFIGNLLGYSAVTLYAQDSLKKRICSRYLKEYGLWSFAMTEGGCGSDLLKTNTKAKRVQGGFEITGEKNFITNAAVSHEMSVFAQLEDRYGRSEGISCFYIEGNSPGLRRGPVMDKVGWRDSVTGTIYFDKVFVPEENLLGKAGSGLKILTHCLNRSKTLLAAMGVGISNHALDLATERLLQTERFDKPLLEQSAIRHVLARLHTEIEAAWMLTCLAASTWDSGNFAVREASMAKLFSGATAVKVTSQALELFGARGFFNDFEISRLWRDAKAIEIVEGPSLVQELLIAKHVLPEILKQNQKQNLFTLTNEDKKKVG